MRIFRFFNILNLESSDLNMVSYFIDIDDILQNIISISYRLGKTNIGTALVIKSVYEVQDSVP